MTDDPTLPLTRTGQVMAAIRQRIDRHELTAGDRVPSIRALAATLGVSPSTVVEAYERLAVEDVIRARRGSGFYVTTAAVASRPLARAGAATAREVDPLWISRQSLDSDAALPKPGCGWLPADWLPTDAIRRALRQVSRADDAVLVEYGPTRGGLPLRRRLLTRLATEGIETTPDQVLLTASGTQAIDLVLRLLIQPGDRVLVDDPCYFNFRAMLRAHPVTVVGVPFTPRGPEVAAFEQAVATHRPRLYLTNSGIHNPTGASWSPAVAHRVLAAAAAHDMTIVEDDIFADFEPEPSPRLAALDGLNRVIRIGSFSKTLSSGLRSGYIAARADWVEALVDLQVATGFGGPSPVVADAIATVLGEGAWRRHLEVLRRRLARARRDTATRLARLGIVPWLMPRGGFYLWCRLPAGCDAASVARFALAEGVVLAPGNVFSVGANAADCMRFNVAQPTGQGVLEVIRRAIAAA